MSLQAYTNINVDFCDKKYILINAKQYDKNSRFLSVTCYNHGEIYPINAGEHAAYIRYRKADENGVFNFCKIDFKGKILVELTEQMLAADGICYADLVIVNKGDADVNADTGEIEMINYDSILSTMTFCIDVTETPIENSDVESSYEYDGLNVALNRAEANYQEVILSAKSWAIGGTGVRSGEDTNNAKYYSEEALRSSNEADTSEANALAYSKLSQSYAVGGTGVRDTETNDNAQYYSGLAKKYYDDIEKIVDGLEGGFIPMGTITFSELATAEKATGYIYNIKDNFVTDETFYEGAGVSYTAGTNVYCRSDDLWDCLGGSVFPIATIDEVVEYLGIEKLDLGDE